MRILSFCEVSPSKTDCASASGIIIDPSRLISRPAANPHTKIGAKVDAQGWTESWSQGGRDKGESGSGETKVHAKL